MATIRDVAKLANVSISTVSRVMNYDSEFQTSQQTKQLIWEAAQSLDYALDKNRRSSSKRSRNTNKNMKVGCILNTSTLKYIDSFYMCLLSNFESEVNRLGGTLIFTKTSDEIEALHSDVIDLYKSVGSIVVMEYLSKEAMQTIKENVPIVLGVDIENPSINTITHDRIEANMIAMNHLVQNGHRRIAYLGGNEHHSATSSLDDRDLSTNKRFWGYRHALTFFGIPYDPIIVKNCRWNIEICRQQVKELLALPCPPTAILAGSDTVAIAAISACGIAGLSVPHDISIMGISNTEESCYSNPPLTTVQIPQKTMGLLAARMLADPPSEFTHKVLVPLTLIERGSVSCIGRSVFKTPREFPIVSQ